MPDASRVLDVLGVEITDSERYAFAGIRYFDGEVMAEGRFGPGSSGLGVRRLVLHRALVRRAQQLGITNKDICSSLPHHLFYDSSCAISWRPALQHDMLLPYDVR